MAHRYLGEPFDIHGGGADLIFPHHENEIAQSEGAFGDGQFARHWLHSGMVNFGGEKMSKSLGNFVTIRKVAETYDLEALRLHLIGVHYRSPVAFTIAHDDKGHARYPEIDEAESRLAYFYRTLERLAAAPGDDDGGAVVPPADKTISAFREAMDDDFNTAAADRPPLRRLSAGQQAARRAGGGGQGRAPPDAGAAAQATSRPAARRWGSSSARRPRSWMPTAFGFARGAGSSRRPSRRASPSAPPPARPRTSPAPTRSARALQDDRRRADGHARRHHLARHRTALVARCRTSLRAESPTPSPRRRRAR